GTVTFAPQARQAKTKGKTASALIGTKAKSGVTITVSGSVVLPDGKTAAGAIVRAAAPLYAMMKPIVGDDFQPPLAQVTADAAGKFSIGFTTQPFGDVSRLEERWQQLWKQTTIAASQDGYGPAWIKYDEVKAGEPVTLRLVEDLPIRGRLINLEGQPIAGATIKIGEPRAAKDEDLSAWIAGIIAGELPWTVVE